MNKLPQFEDHATQVKKTTTCYMCACRCGIEVTLENDQIRFIQGNPDHPVNQGVLCAKGNAGIMKQMSPAKLKNPLMRKPGSERGAGEFVEISWQEALDLLGDRLAKIRSSDPKKLAFFTGRDQMQAFTGLWAQQFGTINWAAHGGFCSVNMAAAGIYTIGHAFWEFGDPDWERCKYFILWGVAEDHASNPIKIGISKLKERGARFVSVNPARTGYSAVADEWVPIRPGTDGLLALSLIHVLLRDDNFDWEFLTRYTNAPALVICNPGSPDDGMLLRNDEGHPLGWNNERREFVDLSKPDQALSLFAEEQTAKGQKVKTVMSLMAEKYLDPTYAPEQAAPVCGLDASLIERLAAEMAHVAFQETITIDCQWTDWAGRTHDQFIGRPVAMHAMRGISAHSNGFQACRALHLLQTLLGTIDVPGGHRAKPPFPRHIPPGIKPARETAPNTPLKSPPLGFPTSPEDLVIDDEGRPLRIDKAYSWEAPLANHGMMQMVIHNAVAGDPYEIDTLMLFMANMAWNSAMNTQQTMEMLCEKHDSGENAGEYKIPFLVVADAFHSETVNVADLVLPDTTYLERHDVISLLDRPISEPDAVCDSIRQPILKPDRNVRPFQDVLFDLAVRLGFPAFVNDEGNAKFSGYTDFITGWEKAPGVGFLGGWRGENGDEALIGSPNSQQWQKYADNGCFYRYDLPEDQRFYRHSNRAYLDWAKQVGFTGSTDPITIELYSETLQRFRLAGQGLYSGPQPKDEKDKQRLVRYFDPLPDYFPTIEDENDEQGEYPFHAVNQRPMFMYHSWDSQNVWLRQILAQNYLYMNRGQGEKLAIDDLSWVWVESRHGKIRAQVKLMEGCQENTVWTWNAIGKQAGAWGLDEKAPEATRSFLMNHLISELLPTNAGESAISNSDPVTGQAAWYDLRVKITPAGNEEQQSWPQFETIKPLSSDPSASSTTLRYSTHPAVRLVRRFSDVLRSK